MKGTSKLIMGATLGMVVTLAVVLALILVLLAELYCSLLLRRRRQLRKTNSSAIPTATTQTTITTSVASPPHTSHSHPQQQHHPPPPPPPPPPPFSRIYAQGVLQAPRSFLLPSVASCKEEMAPKKLHSLLQQTQETNTSALRHVGVLLPSPSSPCSTLQGGSNGAPCNNGGEHLVYISNPIYENEEANASGGNTPFETPDTSPSRLERSDSSGDDGDAAQGPLCRARLPRCTPPLTPMKKLPAEACSVSLRDARSLDTSASDSRSNGGPSSSSSASPCTSPSW